MVILALLLSLQSLAQSPSAFPIDITAGRAPQPVMADGRSRLLYELRLTNFSPKPIELTGLDVLGGDSAGPVASYRGEALEKLLVAVGPTDSVEAPANVAPLPTTVNVERVTGLASSQSGWPSVK